MRNCQTNVRRRYGSEFSRKFNQTVALFEKIEAPFGKIEAPFKNLAPLFFRKVPLNFAKQVVLLQIVAFILICCTVIRSNSDAFIQDEVCAFLYDNSCPEKRLISI